MCLQVLSTFLFLGLLGGAAFLWLKLSNKDGGGGGGGDGDGDALAGVHPTCRLGATRLYSVHHKVASDHHMHDALCTMDYNPVSQC